MIMGGNGRKDGYVYLIGAGPGDPGLLTIKAREALKRCDTVVYDRLCNPSILQECRPGAELIYVGKQPGLHRLSQEGINELLIEKASKGLTVGRLKGGDPFLFGRGGEEAMALAAARIPFEVIPGVTSAVAVPAYAGIPVTHRALSSSLAIITGHEDPSKESSCLDWPSLGRGPDTLVFLMGLGNLGMIADKLIAHGRHPDTPAAVIAWGTTPGQKTITGKLSEIAGLAERKGITHPATVVIGEVVRLRSELNWFENRPLFGRRILVAHTGNRPSGLTHAISAQGGFVLEMQVAQPLAVPDWRVVDRALETLSSYHQVVFTDPISVDFFVQRLMATGRDLRVLSGLQLVCLESGTAAALRRYHLTPDRIIDQDDHSVNSLVVRGWGSYISRRLRGEEIVVYLLQPSADLSRLPAILGEEGLDAVVFTCPASVYPFACTVAGIAGEPLSRTAICCLTSATADAANDLGLAVHVVPRETTPSGVAKALSERLRRWKVVAHD